MQIMSTLSTYVDVVSNNMVPGQEDLVKIEDSFRVQVFSFSENQLDSIDNNPSLDTNRKLLGASCTCNLAISTPRSTLEKFLNVES